MHQDMYVQALTLYLLILVTAAYQPPNFIETKAPSVGSGSMILLPIEGNVYPTGSYTVKISIGKKNPPTKFAFDIDTGSHITWVPCIGATVPPPLYVPEHEPGSSVVMCFDPECKALGAHGNGNCNPALKQPCKYNIRYADGGSSTGTLFKDSIHLELSNGQKVAQRIAFGCGHSQSVKSGVLGLGRGAPGISKQLSSHGVIRDVVGHCLSSTGGGGFIFLGSYDNLPRNMVWKQLLSGSQHYSLGSADLLFDGRLAAKRLQIIFDSGSTYTYFNSVSYGALVGQIQNHLQRHPRRPVNLDRGDKTLPVCWRGPRSFRSIRDAAPYFPNLALSFVGVPNAMFYFSPKHYLIISDKGNACLGILDGTQVGLGDTNVIGDISMQDKLMIYDNENARVGWAGVTSCNSPFLNQ